jgi:hypothetical protein
MNKILRYALNGKTEENDHNLRKSINPKIRRILIQTNILANQLNQYNQLHPIAIGSTAQTTI